jgi:pyruvate dehydrogenase E2 component (dihydrolipoamide acetyltransferase)
MPSEITMPQLSDTMTEGVLVKWLKKEGDKIKEGDAVAEVETDKAVMPMESFVNGTLAATLIGEGEKVKVGAAIAVIALAGEDVAAVKAGGAKAGAAAPVAAVAAVAAVVPVAVAAAAPAKVGAVAGASVGGGTAVLEAPRGGGSRLRVSPLARRVASEKGIDLSTLTGTGPNGRIHVADLANVTATPATPARNSQPATRNSKEVIPLSKMRQVIAQRLQASKQTVPHFYCTVDVDMESSLSFREKYNKQLEKEKIKISVNDLVMKSVAVALVRHPALNAHFRTENGGEIHRFGDVNLGVAVALPDGLIVPVLRGVQGMTLKEIRLRTADLFDRAKQMKLKQDELSGGTFTISNLGAWGVKDFGAIVNPPEVAILAVGGAEPRAVVYNGQLAARTVMSVTLSADHRAIDGALAADFCRTLKGLLEEPALMLV